jgi:multiple sugar transport system permease protein
MKAVVELDARAPMLAVRTAGRRHPSRAGRIRRTALVFLAPAGILFLILIAYPLLRVLWDSLHIVNLVNPGVTGFAGLENYRTVWEDEDFLPAVRNTAVWTILSVVGEYALGLASAVALAQPVRFRAVFRGLIIVPWVIPIAVAGLNWTWMLTPDYGILNVWMVRLGLLDSPYPWLGQIDTALLTVTFVNIWRSFPFYTISLLAALQAIPRELHEAAAVDGAGAWRRFRVITLPHLRTVSLTLIFIHIIWTAINFDFIWVMTEGGPLNASETVPIMIYRYAMQDFDVGAACAVASMAMAFMACLFFVFHYGVTRRGRAA